jgi:hypothetical protein
MLSTVNSTKCVACPASSISTPGATSRASCLCLAGYYLDERLQCAQCPAASTAQHPPGQEAPLRWTAPPGRCPRWQP